LKLRCGFSGFTLETPGKLFRNIMMSFPKTCSVRNVSTAPRELAVTSRLQAEATGARSPQAARALLVSLAVLVAQDQQERAEHQVHQEIVEHQAPLDLLALLVIPAVAEAATAAAAPLDLQDPLEPQAHQVPMAIPELMAPQVMQELQDLQVKQEQPEPQETLVAKDPLDSPVLTPLKPLQALQDLRDLQANVDPPALLALQVLKDSPVVGDHLANVVLEETVVLTEDQVAKVMQVRQDPVATMLNTARVVAAMACAVNSSLPTASTDTA
jgi:hypothetical protein